MSDALDGYIFGSFGWEPEVMSELKEWVEVGHKMRMKLKGAGDLVEARAVRERMMQVFDELHRQGVALRYSKDVPVKWTHGRTDAEIEAKISAPALRKVAAECFDGKRNVLLLGPTGAGKTAAKALMVRRRLFAHREYSESMRRFTFPGVHWVYSRDLANAVSQHPLGKGMVLEVKQCCDAELLVLDDVGQERVGDHGGILDVIHHRNQENKPTWTSSGLTLEELKGRYGEAFVRRLVEVNGQPGKVVACFPKVQLVAGGGR